MALQRGARQQAKAAPAATAGALIGWLAIIWIPLWLLGTFIPGFEKAMNILTKPLGLWFYVVLVVVSAALALWKSPGDFLLESIGKIFGGYYKTKNALTSSAPVAVDPSAPPPFGLWLGKSTGIFANKGHFASIAGGQDVVLGLSDACQNLIIFGGIGAGKTTRVINPLLVQALEQDCGGLIFDIKGDFKTGVYDLASRVNRAVVTVGPGSRPLNLLQGLTPEVSSSFLKSAFILGGGASGDNAFWVDTATELSRAGLGVLSFLPGEYSLEGLYRYLFNDRERERMHQAAELAKGDLDEKQRRMLDSYLAYHRDIFSRFDDKVKAGVNATCAQVLSAFNLPDLVDSFCIDSPDAVNMEEVINGSIILVDLPLPVYGLGAKVAYTFIKLRFMNVMQRRNTVPEWDKTRPVVFMCDEYQEIISASKSGLSDLNFWDKSRSSKCVGIVSTQSIASFFAAIGDRDVSKAVMQNFRQKICFRSEDQDTIETFSRLAGRVEVEKYSSSTSQSKHGDSSSTSVSTREEDVLTAQLFRSLGASQAVALLSIDGIAMDDVLDLATVFTN
jgi:type IV secretory pathway TraG/TraD family ATPase VirD4